MIDYRMFDQIEKVAWVAIVVLGIGNWILWSRASRSLWLPIGVAAISFLIPLAVLCDVLSAAIHRDRAETVYCEFIVLCLLLLAAAVNAGRNARRRFSPNKSLEPTTDRR